MSQPIENNITKPSESVTPNPELVNSAAQDVASALSLSGSSSEASDSLIPEFGEGGGLQFGSTETSSMPNEDAAPLVLGEMPAAASDQAALSAAQRQPASVEASLQNGMAQINSNLLPPVSQPQGNLFPNVNEMVNNTNQLINETAQELGKSAEAISNNAPAVPSLEGQSINLPLPDASLPPAKHSSIPPHWST